MISFSRNCKEIIKKIVNPLGGTCSRPKRKLDQQLGSRYLCSSHEGGSSEEVQMDYVAITNNDKDLENKLKVIMLEAEVLRQDGKAVPPISFFSTEQWREVLNLPTRTARKKYFEFLFKLSKKKENKMAKKEQRRLEFEEFKNRQSQEQDSDENIEDFALRHDLKHNNILLRVYDTTINQMYNNRLIQAIMFGQKLVLDCGYNINMSKRENFNCAKQLMLLFAENRMHDDPFDLHFCNANGQSDLIKKLEKYIPTLYEPWFPLNVHSCSYLDIFPKNELVYLTPHCREELHEFDHDAVYIIGAIVDKINTEPLSLAKAKKEGLKMAKLPLDKYLQWGSGSGKSLTLNQVASILLDAKQTGNWEHALRHVPRRKLVDFNIAENITKTSDSLRYDKHDRRKWIPSANIELGNLSYNRRENRERERLVKIERILKE